MGLSLEISSRLRRIAFSTTEDEDGEALEGIGIKCYHNVMIEFKLNTLIVRMKVIYL